MEVQSLCLFSQEPFPVPVVSHKNTVDILSLLKFPHILGLAVKISVLVLSHSMFCKSRINDGYKGWGSAPNIAHVLIALSVCLTFWTGV